MNTIKRCVHAALIIIAVALLFISCGGVRPPKPPVTPPTPVPNMGVVNAEMLLSRDGVTIKQSNGFAFDFRGAKDCCESQDPEPNPKWPLGSSVRNTWLKSVGNINFVSRRLGPWRGVPGGEEQFLDIGGGYLEVGGKADLAQWNPAFWGYNDNLALDDSMRDQHAQIGVIDGWGMKGGCSAGGPTYHPWAPQNNAQGTAHCSPVFDAVQEAWVRKVVSVLGRHGNVTWEISNEGGLVAGWTVAWEESVIATIKDEETKHGYPHHLIATNSERSVPSADWDEFHTEGGSHPSTGKITGINEYNPEPPLTGIKLAENYCSARASGVYYWAWRHGMSLPEWLKGLAAIKGGCAAVGCSITTDPVPLIASKGDVEHPPVGRRPGSGPQIDGRNGLMDEAEATVRVQHPELFNGDALKDWPSEGRLQSAAAQPYYNRIVEFFRSHGACASAWEDSVAWGWPGDHFFEEWHCVGFGSGKPIDGRHAWQYTWQFPQ